MLAGGLIFGKAAAEKGYAKGFVQALKDVCTPSNNIVDLLVDHSVEKGGVLLQATRHSLAGDIDIPSVLPADTARSLAEKLNEAADIIDASIKPVSIVNF